MRDTEKLHADSICPLYGYTDMDIKANIVVITDSYGFGTMTLKSRRIRFLCLLLQNTKSSDLSRFFDSPWFLDNKVTYLTVDFTESILESDKTRAVKKCRIISILVKLLLVITLCRLQI